MSENPYLMNDDEGRSGASGISGFMLGALVGAGVALLLAPATGTDTRRKVGETVKKLGTAARDRFQQGREELEDRFQGERQGFESGARTGTSGFEAGRREPVPSTGSTTNPGQTGRTSTTPTPGRTTP